MKVTVGIPSRGRPLDLAAAVLALEKTRTQGQGNKVDYLIAVDNDDETVNAVATELALRGTSIRVLHGPRPLGLGELHNRMAAATDPESIFMLWSDRLVPVFNEWNHAVVFAALQHPNRVLWMDSYHLMGACQFILPPKWRSALPGQPCPAVFPFWFEDSHVEEVDSFVHGFPRVSCYAKCAGPRTEKTTRMRDLHFWIDYYTFLRPSRIAEAAKISAALGLIPLKNLAEIEAHYAKRDVDFHARVDELTATYAAPGEPDASYLQAKANAEAVMNPFVEAEVA